MRTRESDIGAPAGRDIANGSLSYGIASRVGTPAGGNTKNLITPGRYVAVCALVKDAY